MPDIENIMSSVQKFRAAVPRIRDIFRKCGISGMDSMRHASLYLLSRFLTIEKASDLEIDTKFAWENMMIAADTSKELALNRFGIDRDCLISQFDRLFDTQKFTFEMSKDKSAHYEIMEILNRINMDEVDLHMDILGYVYEDHLKSGSSNSRDLGQFFTDRAVCKYMVDLCNPVCKRAGVPESMCDPSMGTGGFLTSYMKHFDGIDWNVQQKQIHGWDHDNKVAGFARLNVFMESGGSRFENLVCEDSLKNGLNSSYDVILANMPFGLKGLKYADCHASIKSLKLDGTKSEPLFLQLMMVSLNDGGRCAVVVPDSMLTDTSKCHNNTRKFLIEQFNLKQVIKMNGRMFTDTGIHTSILFFERTGTTEAVEFWEIDKDETGTIIETWSMTVQRESFEGAYSLNKQKYMETDYDEYNPDFPLVELKDVCIAENGKTLASVDKTEGQYNVMGGGTNYNRKYTKYNREAQSMTISKSGTAGYVKWHTEQFWAGDCFTLRTNDCNKMLDKYLYYYLKLNPTLVTERNTCSTIPHCKWEDIETIKLPLPPVEMQQTIVEQMEEMERKCLEAVAVVESTARISKQMMDDILKTN